MHKVIFDIEDRPPPSYYKEMAKLKLETGTSADGQKRTTDKADWCNAPEFVPRSKLPGRTDLNENSKNVAAPNACAKNPRQTIVSHRPIHPGIVLPIQTNVQLPGYQKPFNAAILGQPNIFRPIVPDGLNFPTSLTINGIPHLVPRSFIQPQLQLMTHRPQFRQPILHISANGIQRTVALPLVPTSLPTGYTANVTTIKSALGPQVPAILIKKKRKKKQKLRSSSNEPLMEEKQNETHRTVKESSTEDVSFATESLNGGTSIHTDDEIVDLIEPRATGSLGELSKQTNGNYFPADLDLIQTAGKCAILTGSWPDLSEPQRQSLEAASPTNDFYGAYYQNRQILHHGSNGSINLEDDEEESVQLLTRSNACDPTDGDESADPVQKRTLIVHSVGKDTKSQLLNPQTDVLGFIPYQLRSLSMPDVHVITDKAPKMCCTVM